MRRGLTLIELLITIVIMVTVLAAVLPLVSPNNEVKKTREAARALASLIAQAKAKAASEGRSFGISITESGTSTPYSGMAMEAQFAGEPPPFSGFSETSRANINWDRTTTYGTTGASPNGGKAYSPRYEGFPVCVMNLFIGDASTPDHFPPRMLKIGDRVSWAGHWFLVCDDADETSMPNLVDSTSGVKFLFSDITAPAPAPGSTLNVIWTSYKPGDLLPGDMTASFPLQDYTFRRQPTVASDGAIQFPRGIGVDLQASGAEIGTPVPYYSFDAGGKTVVQIMFSPNGSLDSVIMDGVPLQQISHVYLLLGNIENANGRSASEEFDFAAFPPSDEAEIAARRLRNNWLSPTSRWVSIDASSGRTITTDNSNFNVLEDVDYNGDGTKLSADWKDQITAARKAARLMEAAR